MLTRERVFAVGLLLVMVGLAACSGDFDSAVEAVTADTQEQAASPTQEQAATPLPLRPEARSFLGVGALDEVDRLVVDLYPDLYLEDDAIFAIRRRQGAQTHQAIAECVASETDASVRDSRRVAAWYLDSRLESEGMESLAPPGLTPADDTESAELVRAVLGEDPDRQDALMQACGEAAVDELTKAMLLGELATELEAAGYEPSPAVVDALNAIQQACEETGCETIEQFYSAAYPAHRVHAEDVLIFYRSSD